MTIISKAKTDCEVPGRAIADHFADVRQMVHLGSACHVHMRNIFALGLS